MILLDTHVMLWLATSAPRLGRRTAAAVDKALKRGQLAVSAFSFWEAAMLAAGHRIRLKASIAEIRTDTLGTGIAEIPVDGVIAILSTRLAMHADPADRIIVATALVQEATLATADEAILAMRGAPAIIDARE